MDFEACFRSPERFAPVMIPVQAGKNTASIVKKLSSLEMYLLSQFSVKYSHYIQCLAIPNSIKHNERITIDRKITPNLDTQFMPNQLIIMIMIRASTEKSHICNSSGPKVNPDATFKTSIAPMIYIAPDKVVAK